MIVLLNSADAKTAYSTDLEDKLIGIVSSKNVVALGASAFTIDRTSRAAVVGFRKNEDPTLASQSDKFHLGSCTKAMTATLVAKLIENGMVNWNTTLDEVFPDIKVHPKYKIVTLEMLLAHQGGVTDDLSEFDSGILWRHLWDPQLPVKIGRKQVANEILSITPKFEPGTGFHYSNAGYIIVGSALEQVSGSSWEDLMEMMLFAPLEMNSCGFGAAGNAQANPPDQPWSHQYANGEITPIEPGFFADNPTTLGPAGTVHCSMTDWTKFLQEHLKGFWSESHYLTTESFLKLQTPFLGSDYSPGGWFVANRDWADGVTLSHGGSNTMNFSLVWLAPKQKKGYISVTNSGGPGSEAVDEAVTWMISGH
jgi:CubicO group peptidase (beta-lactamase class C family)